MEAILNALQQTFESSSSKTPQYLLFHKLFKREFTKELTKLGCKAISVHKPNHFDVSGFFTDPNDQVWYFSLSDLRWSKDKLLIRTAKNYTDFTGGGNQYISFDNEFLHHLKTILRV